jgi:hypothetical protein
MARRKQYGPYFIVKSLDEGPRFQVIIPKAPTTDPDYRVIRRTRGPYNRLLRIEQSIDRCDRGVEQQSEIQAWMSTYGLCSKTRDARTSSRHSIHTRAAVIRDERPAGAQGLLLKLRCGASQCCARKSQQPQ